MLIPVRCFSCGKPVAQLWDAYKEKVDSGADPGKVLDSLGLKRYCCRRMLLTHREYIDDVMKYKK